MLYLLSIRCPARRAGQNDAGTALFVRICSSNSLLKDRPYVRLAYMTVGTSPMTPAQILVELWPKIHALCPEIKFQLWKTMRLLYLRGCYIQCDSPGSCCRIFYCFMRISMVCSQFLRIPSRAFGRSCSFRAAIMAQCSSTE